MCTFCLPSLWDRVSHIQCSTFNHTGGWFQYIVYPIQSNPIQSNPIQSLHTFLSQSECGFSIGMFISNILEHWESVKSTHLLCENVSKFGSIHHIDLQGWYDSKIHWSIHPSVMLTHMMKSDFKKILTKARFNTTNDLCLFTRPQNQTHGNLSEIGKYV